MAWNSYTARTFIEDLVLQPPVLRSGGSGELSNTLELALRQYRMSVLEAFGPVESQQELVWDRMRSQEYNPRGTRASGMRLAVAAAKRIQDGVEHGHEYAAKELRRDAEQILALVRRASPAVVERSPSTSDDSKDASPAWLAQASESLAEFRQILAEPERAPGEVPPLEVAAAWRDLVACASRDVVLSVWTQMEQIKYGNATLASLVRAWAVVAHKACVASMHGGDAAASALQIDAAKQVIQELVVRPISSSSCQRGTDV
ncbi:uncharacterized protein RHOBADRAFT_44179 [Rhodotorula graminis WP1]|uniref:Uncharacterized protein n=1 Tax=Rhodotorula graminis (strain WP1) TaxID=578459 RepID=A0A194S2B8_RHOGW|nr:uncharacterized protein RHOBADRAFT_44179 [Rhodotorula graminis WP1]KPV74664.1 hypothetical protein RHOBADRAFT_44179 [Rhodotorula graminis WP1]